MLSNVLEKETCANCRICCSFVRDDVWEAPVFRAEEVALAVELGVEKTAFEPVENTEYYRAKYEFRSDSEILLCPCLDEKKGCVLGRSKPFECSIWPVRIFEDAKGVHLGVAEMCPAFQGDRRKALVRELKECGLEARILENREKQLIVKENEEGYARV